MSASAPRIGPQEARERLTSGEALLVCAYDNDEKFRKNHLEGAVSLQEFQVQADSLPKDRQIIFY